MVKDASEGRVAKGVPPQKNAVPKSASDANLPESEGASGGRPTVVEPSKGKAPNDAVAPGRDSDLHDDSADQRHEVRAGPGDAGAQDAPEILPRTPKTPKASFARIVLWFVVPFAVLLALYWAMSA